MMTTMMIMMTRTTFMMVTMGVMKMIIIIQGNWHWRYWWCDQAVCNTNCTNCWFVKNCVFLNCLWHYYFIVLNKQRYHFHFVFWGSVAKKPRVRIDGSLPAAWQDEKKSMLLRCGSWSSAIVFLFLVWPCLSLGDQAAAASEIRHGKAAVTSWQVQQKKQFLILSWLHARLEKICPQVSFACNIGTFGFVALCLSTFGFQCDSVLLTFGIHWPFSIFGVSTFTCLVDAVQFVFLWFVFLDVKDSTRSWSRGVLVAQHGYLKIRQVKHMWKSRRKNQQFSIPFDLQAWNFFDQLLVGSKSFDPCLSTCCLDETNCSISNL